MKQVVILQGIPGSGKSTLAKKLCTLVLKRGKTCVIVSVDHYFEKNGFYKFNPTKLPEAHDECALKFREAIQKSVNLIIVDNTNIVSFRMIPYIQFAKKYQYRVSLNRLEIDSHMAFKRNIHSVPYETIRRMNRAMSEEKYPVPVRRIK
jgi:tRNA uridine 5-carbamoylmethylation protein Kti12